MQSVELCDMNKNIWSLFIEKPLIFTFLIFSRNSFFMLQILKVKYVDKHIKAT